MKQTTKLFSIAEFFSIFYLNLFYLEYYNAKRNAKAKKVRLPKTFNQDACESHYCLLTFLIVLILRKYSC